MSRENFYILLELPFSPPENDINKINAAIHQKQAGWSALRNHPTKGRQAQLYLDMLPEIKAVMMDENKRKEEAQQAKILSAQQEKEKYQELDEAIRLLSPKRHITEEEITKLSQRYSFSEEVIKKRVKVPIVKGKSSKQPAQRLEPSIQKKISDSLTIVGKKSLYDFLELAPTSSINTLISRTKEKDSELKKESLKDARLTAGVELIGHCLNVFKTEDMRKMYDAALAYQKLAELNKALDIVGIDGRIEVEEFDTLMKKGMELGLKFDEAEEYIIDYCTKKKWIVRSPTRPLAADMKPCGNCGLLNTPDAKNCSGCGYLLEVHCPKCKSTNPSTSMNCSKCGFPIGDMPNALPLVKEAKEAHAGGDIKKAAGLFRKALLFWPDHPEALAVLQEIETREKEISKLSQELDELVNDRKYYKAHQVLSRLKQLDGTQAQFSNEAKITAKISSAESWIIKARTAAKGDDALDYFNQALLECKDCREAIEGMAKFPPEPPGNLEVIPNPRSISLQWKKSSSRGTISYRIARKPQSPPLNAHDGENIGETTQALFDDPDSLPGVFYYYGIYSQRGEVFSVSGAIAGPVIRTAEIENLCITPGDSVINLNWQAPPNLKEILVYIKVGGIPNGKNDGQVLQGVRSDGITAAGLTNGRLYGFLIQTLFINEKGTAVYSPGITCQSRPASPPQAVKDIKVAKKENKIIVNWTPPERGTVQIYYSQQSFALCAGEIIPAGKLAGIGTQVPVQQAGRVQISIDFQGIIHILPVTIEGDMAVVGESTAATSLDEVSQLKGYINYGKLYLEWEWPTGAQKVLIMYNNQNFPAQPGDTNAVQKIFTRVEYLRNPGFVIRTVEPKDYYFTVFVTVGDGENVLYSPGQHYLVTNTTQKELYYEIHLVKNLMGKVKSGQLKLFSKEDHFKIPAAVLVKKNQNLPIRKTDGLPILEIGPLDIGRSPVSIEIPAKEIGKGVYARLFFRDDDQHKKYRIMMPPKEKLQLG